MRLISGVVRKYEWGSRTAIPDLVGVPGTGEPWAELWLGAHPDGPAAVGPAAEPLDGVIEADPVAALGPEAAARFGRLPFLVKVLAAAAPLSLQAHPSKVHAEAGFEREQSLGVPLDAPQRMFKDRTHKPELVCALSPLEALCGFRDPARTEQLLDTIDTAALDPVRRRLTQDSDSGRRRLLRWLLTLSEAEAAGMVDEVVKGCRAAPDLGEWAAARAAIVELGTRYPRDGAVIVALLLNHVVLQPGEALFLPAGMLHAYLGGMAVEVMAQSDNVVRGGLTSKHVDIETLLDVVGTATTEVSVQRLEPSDGAVAYCAPAEEFSLCRYHVDGSAAVGPGPAVLLCTDGCAEAGGVTLDRGAAAWVGASEPSVVLSGRATVFRVGVGDGALTTGGRGWAADDDR